MTFGSYDPAEVTWLLTDLSHVPIEAPHYAVSIVRGGGIDEVALDHVLSRHRARDVRFVDGWTGKGAIARELSAAVSSYRAGHPDAADLDDELAVLADPGSCTTLY